MWYLCQNSVKICHPDICSGTVAYICVPQLRIFVPKQLQIICKILWYCAKMPFSKKPAILLCLIFSSQCSTIGRQLLNSVFLGEGISFVIHFDNILHPMVKERWGSIRHLKVWPSSQPTRVDPRESDASKNESYTQPSLVHKSTGLINPCVEIQLECR